MGKLRKKGTSGEAAMYINRTKAVRKLQLTLPDFRRLCILKGIYPREPKNKKKAAKGDTANRTYYLVKDIAFLAHEPLIEKFRDFKIFIRKMKKAVAKKETAQQERLEASKPKFKLDHVIKERYPTFLDAVRDLDDALCMLFLFASMPTAHKVQSETTTKCKQLCLEFQHYLIRTGSIRKVFASIKGIYYQAEIMGQPVTWITPYKFSMDVPTDVDFRIMDTFLQFYSSLMSFVNCRLYSMMNLQYPPKIDKARDGDDAGLDAIVLEAPTAGIPLSALASADPAAGGSAADADAQKQATSKRVSSLAAALPGIASSDAADAAAEDASANSSAAGAPGPQSGLDQFPTQIKGGEDTVAEIAAAAGDEAEVASLFKNLWFFLNREVRMYNLELVIRACGGHVSWQGLGADDAEGKGPYSEDDKRITHHIIDRPKLATQHLQRHYVQPQWIFDSINQCKRLPTAPYTIGAKLPSHLSPFVSADSADYVPPEALGSAEGGGAAGEDEGSEDEDDEDDEDEDDAEDEEEATYRKELEAEKAGASVEEAGKAAKAKAAKAKSKKSKAPTTEEEHTELAKSMMSKKDKRLYGAIMHGKAKKKAEVDNLRQKRKNLDQGKPSGDKGGKKAKKAK